jgi:hypothetical protein
VSHDFAPPGIGLLVNFNSVVLGFDEALKTGFIESHGPYCAHPH